MAVTRRPMTAEALARLPRDPVNRYELVRGELVRMTPVGGEHGKVALTVVVVAQGGSLRIHDARDAVLGVPDEGDALTARMGDPAGRDGERVAVDIFDTRDPHHAIEVDAGDRVDGIDQRHRIGAPAQGGLGRGADGGDDVRRRETRRRGEPIEV